VLGPPFAHARFKSMTSFGIDDQSRERRLRGIGVRTLKWTNDKAIELQGVSCDETRSRLRH